jgi:sterol desaturase/sphingolipid hydroxylase (fatty acid hydroxylase superfamily)
MITIKILSTVVGAVLFSDFEGAMTANFGICFFFFDRVFGTLVDTQERLNWAGLSAAETRYSFIYR